MPHILAREYPENKYPDLEGRRKRKKCDIRGMREYAPENEVTNCV